VLKIGVVGDYDPANETHRATDAAFVHASAAVGAPASASWLGTDQVASAGERELRGYDCFLIAPGSPYRSLEGALDAIRFARENDVPCLGTCGGFQHMVLELARDILGYPDADHAESNPAGRRLFITPLSCSLKGQTMDVILVAGSLAARSYGQEETKERYYCDFGLNPEYAGELEATGLVVSGSGPEGEARIVELPSRRFFMGTLFVPQASSTLTSPHPLIVGLLEAAIAGAPVSAG
jgi:CTP synthase (UTP-ammonia lyase)